MQNNSCTVIPIPSQTNFSTSTNSISINNTNNSTGVTLQPQSLPTDHLFVNNDRNSSGTPDNIAREDFLVIAKNG